MPSTELDDDIIGAIYDAALSAQGLDALTAAMAGTVGSSSVVLFLTDRSRGVEIAAHSLPLSALTDQLAYYLPINPLSVASQVVPPLTAARGEDVLPLSEYRKSEFYVDFAAPLDSVEAIGARLPVAPGVNAEICLHRGSRMCTYGDRDVARVQRFVPHLQRALQMRRRIAPQGQNFALAALDVLAEPAVILGPDGRVVFANQAAEALATSGDLALGGAAPGLMLPVSSDGQRFATLARDAGTGGAGGAMAATGWRGGRLFLLVSPLPGRLGASPGHVLVMIRQPDVRQGASAETLRELFGLTPAEARLAAALAAGETVPGLVAAWGLSENTLRSQLSAVFGKTGVSGQRDLAALLAAIPGRFPPDVPSG